jgi:hypothetical protein
MKALIHLCWVAAGCITALYIHDMIIISRMTFN